MPCFQNSREVPITNHPETPEMQTTTAWFQKESLDDIGSERDISCDYRWLQQKASSRKDAARSPGFVESLWPTQHPPRRYKQVVTTGICNLLAGLLPARKRSEDYVVSRFTLQKPQRPIWRPARLCTRTHFIQLLCRWRPSTSSPHQPGVLRRRLDRLREEQQCWLISYRNISLPGAAMPVPTATPNGSATRKVLKHAFHPMDEAVQMQACCKSQQHDPGGQQ